MKPFEVWTIRAVTGNLNVQCGALTVATIQVINGPTGPLYIIRTATSMEVFPYKSEVEAEMACRKLLACEPL